MCQEGGEEAHMSSWVMKDKLLKAHKQPAVAAEGKGSVAEGQGDGQGAPGTTQTPQRSAQEDGMISPLPEDAGEEVGKPKFGWSWT